MAEIRPNEGAAIVNGRCDDTDEVVGEGHLHVEQVDDNCYWARLDMPDGKAIVMWFRSSRKVKLIAEWDLRGVSADTTSKKGDRR